MPLLYQGQSGALKHSITSTFGLLVKQWSEKKAGNEPSWVVGEGLLADGVSGRGLQDFSAPGSAYNDRLLGQDPQPRHMSGYVETDADNGGVHINSGIVNHAFYLAATMIGGPAWDKPGKIWWRALTMLKDPKSNFADFANATIKASEELYGVESSERQSVEAAWRQVGVL